MDILSMVGFSIGRVVVGSGWFVSDALNAVEFMVRNSLNPLLSLRCPTRTLKLSKCWAWALGMMGNASSCGYHFFLSPLSYSAIFYFKCVTFGADLCAITVMICLNKKNWRNCLWRENSNTRFPFYFQRLGSNLWSDFSSITVFGNDYMTCLQL